MRRPGRVGESARSGLTLVEVMLAMSVLITVMGLSLFMFHQAAGLFQETDLACHLVEREQNALNMLRQDLRETGSSTVVRHSFTDANFSELQRSWALATARDSGGAFQVDAGNEYRADWQGVVVYCPYMTAGGVRELRRYVVYGSYTYPFSFDSITVDTIFITENDSTVQIQIDRHAGSVTTTPPGQAAVGDPVYSVACTMIVRTDLDTAGDPLVVTLNAQGTGRTGDALARELKAYVHPTN